MRYWLFMVMYEQIPRLWQAMVEGGVAVQLCPPGWTDERRSSTPCEQFRAQSGAAGPFRTGAADG